MTLSTRQRILVAIGAATGACAIAVPAALALSHNPSLGERIPVRMPSSANVVSFDNHGGVVEVVHHHRHRTPDPTRRHDDPSSTAVPSSSMADDRSSAEPQPGDDRGRGAEPGDDHGGDHSGDDHSGDDHGGHGGSH